MLFQSVRPVKVIKHTLNSFRGVSSVRPEGRLKDETDSEVSEYLLHSQFFLSMENTGLGSYETLATKSSATEQYITLFYVFQLKNIIFNIYCSFINIELMANSTITHP